MEQFLCFNKIATGVRPILSPWSYRTKPNRTVILLERTVSIGHRLPYCSVFFQKRYLNRYNDNYFRFWFKSVNRTVPYSVIFLNLKPHRTINTTVNRFMVKKREPHRIKSKNVFSFNFYREPRTVIK